MRNITYGRLDKVLRSLGFNVRELRDEPPTKVYTHPESGALMTIPVFNPRKKVYAHHLAIVRGTLEIFGIASPNELDELADELQRAS